MCILLGSPSLSASASSTLGHHWGRAGEGMLEILKALKNKKRGWTFSSSFSLVTL